MPARPPPQQQQPQMQLLQQLVRRLLWIWQYKRRFGRWCCSHHDAVSHVAAALTDLEGSS